MASLEVEQLLAEQFSTVKLIAFAQNIGYARGVNAGLKIAQGDFLLILNPDIIVTAGAVQSMIEYLTKHPTTGLIGPQLLSFNGQPQNSCFRFYKPLTIFYRRTFLGGLPGGKTELDFFHLNDQAKSTTLEPDWLMGSALLTTRQAVERVGLMDERFFLYFEDVDWARRFWENGYRVVYQPSAKMFHYHQRRSRAGLDVFDVLLRKEARWHIISGLRYFIKHGWRYQSGQQLLWSNRLA